VGHPRLQGSPARPAGRPTRCEPPARGRPGPTTPLRAGRSVVSRASSEPPARSRLSTRCSRGGPRRAGGIRARRPAPRRRSKGRLEPLRLRTTGVPALGTGRSGARPWRELAARAPRSRARSRTRRGPLPSRRPGSPSSLALPRRSATRPVPAAPPSTARRVGWPPATAATEADRGGGPRPGRAGGARRARDPGWCGCGSGCGGRSLPASRSPCGAPWGHPRTSPRPCGIAQR